MQLGFGNDNMQIDDRGSGERSSSPMSSPPLSPQNYGNVSSHDVDTIHVAPVPKLGSGGGVNSGAIPQTTSGSTSKSTTSTADAEKPKRQRKKKEPVLDANGKPIEEKKVRKPRAPKDPNAPAARKKQKTGEASEKITQNTQASTSAQSRQPTIHDAFHPPSASPAPSNQPQIYHQTSDNIVRSSVPPTMSHNATPRPYSSGQNYYDPIRGSTVDTSRPIPSQLPPAVTQATSPTKRASPSIASLVNPPQAATKASPPPTSMQQTMTHPSFVPPPQQPPPGTSSNTFAPPSTKPSPPVSKPQLSTMDGAMDIDMPICEAPLPKPPPPEVKKAPSKSSSSAPTPKEAPKVPVIPKASGTGLLAASALFGGPSASTEPERKAVDIEICIPLDPAGGNTVNIAQEIVKKYGADAINPRAAAHREQLLRLAAQQSRLEGNATDDMSVDLMSEMEGDSNVEMGGMESGEKPKKRRAKVDVYDQTDDFIDDTELAWEAGAAVAKDGFFVYSGPLVPAGESAQVESSAPTRGRGRGRGRGRAAAAAGTTHAGLAEKKQEAGTTSTRARGTRARGTTTTRKPRMTKADRERMENDKIAREREAGFTKAPPGAQPQMGLQMQAGPLS